MARDVTALVVCPRKAASFLVLLRPLHHGLVEIRIHRFMARPGSVSGDIKYYMRSMKLQSRRMMDRIDWKEFGPVVG